jgi:hypothetical protein
MNGRAQFVQRTIYTDSERWTVYLTNRSVRIKKLSAINFILAEYDLRGKRRCEEALVRNVTALRKATCTDSEKSRLEERQMTQDCSDQGGGCSRGCECCEQMISSYVKKGTGHFTPECWYYPSFRGYGLTEEEKKEIKQKSVDRLNEDYSPYLMTVAD